LAEIGNARASAPARPESYNLPGRFVSRGTTRTAHFAVGGAAGIVVGGPTPGFRMDDDRPQPQRTLITSRREYLDGVERLLVLAQRELRVFDPDLADLDFNAQARIDALRRLLSGGSLHRVYVALHDVEHVKRRCPRLLDLIATFPTALLVFRTEGEATKAQDRFVLADETHCIRRPVATQPRGAIFIDDPIEAHAMRQRFDEIWGSSVPAVSATNLGL
jgi:hypothetical protein